MKKVRFQIFVLLAALAMVVQACSIRNYLPWLKATPPHTPTPTPILLGAEIRSEAGGFVLNAPHGYTVVESPGMLIMEGPDAAANTGPYIVVTGGLVGEPTTSAALAEDLMSHPQVIGSIELVNQSKTQVDDVEGYLINLEGKLGDLQITGRAVVAAVAENQAFTMIALAPEEDWVAFLPYFNALVGSVQFFSPTAAPGVFHFQVTPLAQGTELRQWAAFAWASSQKDAQDGSAGQIIGAPDSLTCEESTTAWSPAENADTAWVYAAFENPVYPIEINIHQNWNPGLISAVYVVSADGETEEQVYRGGHALEEDCPAVLSIDAAGIDYAVGSIKIVLQPDRQGAQSWPQIDAVELVGAAP